MSGGSYDYLYSKSAEDLIVQFSVKQQLDFMIYRLEELGYGDIALDSKILKVYYNKIEEILCKMQERIDKLSPVWHDVEWLDSSDICLDTLVETIDKYRKNNL